LVEALLADDIAWFPIRHYSPRAAALVDSWIRQLRPSAVLVEAPDDAEPLLDVVLDADARLPLAFVSSYEDRRNRFGLNGVCSPDADTPARFRSWFPLVEGTPEVAALRAGRDVGARLGFIDAPFTALIPFEFAGGAADAKAPSDGVLAYGAWARAVCEATGCPDFDAFWHRHMEAPERTVDAWRRDVAAYAWCVRSAEDAARFERDGTALREAHMRARIDAVRREVSGRVLVVAGALHVVALPWTRPRRARGVADAAARSAIGPVSHRSLVRLTGLEPRPSWPGRAFEAIRSGAGLEEASIGVAVEVVRAARSRGLAASTADAVAAGIAARKLAALRGSGLPSVLEVLDGVRMALARGEGDAARARVDAAIDDVLVGPARGLLPPGAPIPPLLVDFHARANAFRLPSDGVPAAIRCEIGRRPEHRARSAFLHRCRRLGLPVFAGLPDLGGRSFRGPADRRDAHLLAETWGWALGDDVDATLLELCDRGETVEAVAVDLNRDDALAGRGNPSALAAALLDAARMRLDGRVGDLLDAVVRAAADESDAHRLVAAIESLVHLHDHAHTLETLGDDRVGGAVRSVHRRAVQRLRPLAFAEEGDVGSAVRAVHAVARVSLGFPGLGPERPVLVDALDAMSRDPKGRAAVRGVALGELHAFGAADEGRVLAEVRALIAGSSPEEAGRLLEGLFVASRGLILLGDVLWRGVDDAVCALDDDTFHRLLPDLRRAFTAFTPSEIAALGARVARDAGLREPAASTVDLGALDRRASEVLARWGL
jgi:hypothetical protein